MDLLQLVDDNITVGRTFHKRTRRRRWNKAAAPRCSGMSKIDILDKPIERIQETCAMMGIADQFDRALPELETFLEGEVANGESSETRLTYDGLCYLRQILRQP
jgi:hypothetical protein